MKVAVNAGTQAKIAAVAPEAAGALVTLGGDFLAVMSRRIARRKSGGATTVAAEAEGEAQAAKQSVDLERGKGVGGPSRPAPASRAPEEGQALPAGTRASGWTGESTKTAEQVGHPVNPATGAVSTEQTDFTLPGPLPLVFRRLWISSSSLAGELGHGWHHTLDMALLPRPDGKQALRLADGRLVMLDTDKDLNL
ncbi:MAG: DUF6531 domain-containing protein [Janthinobacterium lividum]